MHKQNSLRKIFVAVVILNVILMNKTPGGGLKAQTTQSSIIDILKKISELQLQLEKLKAQNSSSVVSSEISDEQETFCYTWNKNLRIGMKNNEDVKALQNALLIEAVYKGKVDGNFGFLTFKAVKDFQTKYGLKVDGYVGTATRVKLNELYECSPDDPTPTPTLTLSQTPTPTLSVDLKINGSDIPSFVGFESIITASWTSTGTRECTASGHYVPLTEGGLWTDLSNLSSSGSKTLYARHNVFGYINPLELTMQCFNDFLSQSTTDTVTVSVITPIPIPIPIKSINVLSPNGGEKWEVGGKYKIIWDSANLPKGAEGNITIIIIRPVNKKTGLNESKIIFNNTENDGVEEWLIPKDFIIGNDYKIEIFCIVPKIPCPVDLSDKPFSIIKRN